MPKLNPNQTYVIEHMKNGYKLFLSRDGCRALLIEERAYGGHQIYVHKFTFMSLENLGLITRKENPNECDYEFVIV